MSEHCCACSAADTFASRDIAVLQACTELLQSDPTPRPDGFDKLQERAVAAINVVLDRQALDRMKL